MQYITTTTHIHAVQRVTRVAPILIIYWGRHYCPTVYNITGEYIHDIQNFLPTQFKQSVEVEFYLDCTPVLCKVSTNVVKSYFLLQLVKHGKRVMQTYRSHFSIQVTYFSIQVTYFSIQVM